MAQVYFTTFKTKAGVSLLQKLRTLLEKGGFKESFEKDEVKIPINGDLVKEVKIGATVAHADTLISISHFKGHEPGRVWWSH
ncbi:MAG: DUF362 domain-containing protein [Thermotogota bacterium]|nr:DUF362 domain-containing protein [Thermotogota bacterium]